MAILVFQLAVLLFSVVIHEVSHGLIAEKLGDPTARLAGRLTLNPFKHLDPVGSLIVPSALFFVSGGSFIFGWARPVPYNPLNLKNPDKAAGIIAAAGPASNLFLAFIFSAFYKILLALSGDGTWLVSIAELTQIIVLVNILLAVFNLVPLPPLDGSKVLFALLGGRAYVFRRFLEQYGQFLLIFFIFFAFRLIYPIVQFIYNLLI